MSNLPPAPSIPSGELVLEHPDTGTDDTGNTGTGQHENPTATTSTTNRRNRNDGHGQDLGGFSLSEEMRENEDRFRRHMLPCSFFAKGYCPFGSRCRFYHPNAYDMGTAFQVPPLPQGFTDYRDRQLPTANGGHAAPVEACDDGLVHGGHLVQPQQPEPNSGQSLLDGVLEQTELGPIMGQPQPEEQEPEPEQPPLPVHETLFSHIDWENFLAPGVLPPPIVYISGAYEHEELVELVSGRGLGHVGLPIVTAVVGSGDCGDGTSASIGEGANSSTGDGDGDGTVKKLNAKLELKLKMQAIAKELAAEAEASLDSPKSQEAFWISSPENDNLVDEPGGVDESGSVADKPEAGASIGSASSSESHGGTGGQSQF